ncbi:MAG: hypothetical protein PHC62_08665 [Candidatus Izemoplasmatales bacterium]|nr:hypothetical protein [Candidatus Izemoplasmatales bacterium]
MSTFNYFIPENCVGRKFRWTRFNDFTGENKITEDIVKSADEGSDGALYTKDGRCFCMKELELGNASLEWID